MPTGQISGFICQLVQSLQAMAPFIVMLSLAGGLTLWLFISPKRRNVAWLIITPLIGLGLIKLGAILGAFGVSACGS